MPVLQRYTDKARERERAAAVGRLAEIRAASSFYGPDDSEPGQWGIAPFAYDDATDEHDPLPGVNYRVVLSDLAEVEGSGAYEATIRSWVGGIPIHYIVFRTDVVDAVDALVTLVDAYESYPVLDEEALSEAEQERWHATLENYLQWESGRTEYDPELAGKLASYLSESHEVWDGGDLWGDRTLDSLARPWLVSEGYVEPDPERGEEPRTPVEETLLLHNDITARLRARNKAAVA